VHFEEKGPRDFQMAYAGKISPGDPEQIEEMPDNTIAIVGLKGELTKYDGLCNYGALSTANLIKHLGMSKNITGVVLDVDGPGGSVNAIAPLIEAMDFVKQMGKPLVVHGDMVASAHLYVAVHADRFILDNEIASQAGSVGTLIQFADYKEYFESKGVKIHTIYAPESTHKNREFEKALEGDYKEMKERVLSPLARKFQDAVREKRAGKLDEKADGILNGAMFWGADAVKYGLADGIGTLGNAIQQVLDLNEIWKFMRK
jgi:protease IV